VVPALAESEFGVPRGSFMLLVATVVAFGFVKGTMNFVAGRLAERIGRKRVLHVGWLIALPIPLVIYYAPSWNWIVLATISQKVNQGLTWSMTQTAKLDIARADQRGLVIGLNEFSGFLGVAAAGVVTGYTAALVGPRAGLLWFGAGDIARLVGGCRDTALGTRRGQATRCQRRHVAAPTLSVGRKRKTIDERDVCLDELARPPMAAIYQAGLLEKFVDALVWVSWPVYLHQPGVSLPGIGWIVGA